MATSLFKRSQKYLSNLIGAAAGRTIPNPQGGISSPAIRQTSPSVHDQTGEDDLENRQVKNDPREVYWGVLPNKIEPKQALWMIRAAMAGDMWQQWRLDAAMTDTWPKYAMAKHQLRSAVSYVHYSINPFIEDGAEKATANAVKNCDLVVRALRSMRPSGFNDERNNTGMIYDFCDAIAMGITLEEIIWDEPTRAPGGMWQRLPRATAWVHPRHFTWNSNGDIIIFNSASQITSEEYRRYGKGVGEIPNPDKFICSQWMSRSGSSCANGFMRQLVWWWCARQYGLDFILKLAKNFGGAYVNVKYKPGMTLQEKTDLLKEIIKGMSNRVLMSVEGTETDIVDGQQLSTENPQRWIIEESDREALYLLLGQTGTTMSTPGKLGNEETHGAVKEEVIKGIAKWNAENPLNQFARAVLRVNTGSEKDCPIIEPDFTKPLNSGEVGKLATDMNNSKAPVKVQQHYKKLGYDAPEPGDLVLQDGQFKIMMEPLSVKEQKANAQAAQQNNKPKPDASKLVKSSSNEELAELETLLKAAETAPIPNGELKALEDWITLKSRG